MRELRFGELPFKRSAKGHGVWLGWKWSVTPATGPLLHLPHMRCSGCVTGTQVLPPAVPETRLMRRRLLRKESGSFKCQSPEEMGDPCHKAHLNISVQVQVLIKREGEAEQRDQGEGAESSLRADQHSPF